MFDSSEGNLSKASATFGSKKFQTLKKLDTIYQCMIWMMYYLLLYFIRMIYSLSITLFLYITWIIYSPEECNSIFELHCRSRFSPFFLGDVCGSLRKLVDIRDQMGPRMKLIPKRFFVLPDLIRPCKMF